MIVFHPRKKRPALHCTRYPLLLQYYTYCCTYVLKRNRGCKIKSPGDYIAPSPEKKRLPCNRKPQKRGLEKILGRTCLSKPRKPFPSRIPSFPGDRASSPRESTFPESPLAEFDGGGLSFAGGTEGCLCRAGVAPSRGRGVSGSSLLRVVFPE